jgi:hypothetical protein
MSTNKKMLVSVFGLAALVTGCATQPPPRVVESSIVGESVEEILASTTSESGAKVAAPEQVPFGSTDYDVSFTPTARTREVKNPAVSLPMGMSHLAKRDRLEAVQLPVVPSSNW